MATKFTTHELLADRPIAFKDIGPVLLAPPAWTRLEPQTLSGEPDAGIEDAGVLGHAGVQLHAAVAQGLEAGGTLAAARELAARD